MQIDHCSSAPRLHENVLFCHDAPPPLLSSACERPAYRPSCFVIDLPVAPWAATRSRACRHCATMLKSTRIRSGNPWWQIRCDGDDGLALVHLTQMLLNLSFPSPCQRRWWCPSIIPGSVVSNARARLQPLLGHLTSRRQRRRRYHRHTADEIVGACDGGHAANVAFVIFALSPAPADVAYVSADGVGEQECVVCDDAHLRRRVAAASRARRYRRERTTPQIRKSGEIRLTKRGLPAPVSPRIPKFRAGRV